MRRSSLEEATGFAKIPDMTRIDRGEWETKRAAAKQLAPIVRVHFQFIWPSAAGSDGSQTQGGENLRVRRASCVAEVLAVLMIAVAAVARQLIEIDLVQNDARDAV